MTNATDVKEFEYPSDGLSGLIVLSAGFEDRAKEFISKVTLDKSSLVVLVKFNNDIEGNDEVFQEYLEIIKMKIDENRLITVSLSQKRPWDFPTDFKSALKQLPRDAYKIYLDISGMPSHAICISLEVLRGFKPEWATNVIYTSALNYHPNRNEFEKLKKKQADGIEYLPTSLAKEMSENLILNQFSGQRTNEGQSCLALFAGYEVHRSAGVIENVNPSVLLLLYGKPEGSGLDWRLDLSKQLHERFEKTRKSAVEEVSTLYLRDALAHLEEYYNFLYDEYDLTIAPVCSKMHAVATYVFWEKYKEIQLIFPLPIGYATDKKAEGVGKTYTAVLEPRSSLYEVELSVV